MAVDLTVAAVPFYFGSMAVEQRWLARRAAAQGPSAADYTKPDTVASLTMGVGSLLAPLLADRIVRQLAPGTGRHPKALVRTAAVAAAVTTLADRLARWDDRPEAETLEPGAATNDSRSQLHPVAPAEPRAERRRRVGRLARAAGRIGGPVAVGSALLAASTASKARTAPRRQWARNGGRDLGDGPLAWLVAIAGWDFIYYWNHRFMHEVRALWAIHVVHHSSERYNLSTALRQPVADVLGVFVPYGLLARLGVRPALIEQARGVNLLYQYWIHTDAIRRLGAAEEVLNTPSHHRVHHGSNQRYLDRNHGSILIAWDRLFGTFQREDEPVVYGLTKNIDTYNPGRIAGHEYADIVRDVAGATTWGDRLSFVLRGPGWAYRRHAANAAQPPSAPEGTEAETAPARRSRRHGARSRPDTQGSNDRCRISGRG